MQKPIKEKFFLEHGHAITELLFLLNLYVNQSRTLLLQCVVDGRNKVCSMGLNSLVRMPLEQWIGARSHLFKLACYVSFLSY